jgi:integrase
VITRKTRTGMVESSRVLRSARSTADSGSPARGTHVGPSRPTPPARHAFAVWRSIRRKAGLRRIRFHDLRHSTATLLLEQGVELVVIKELLGHTHLGVTATVYAHVRLRLQRDATDTLSTALDSPVTVAAASNDGGEPPPCAAPVR